MTGSDDALIERIVEGARPRQGRRAVTDDWDEYMDRKYEVREELIARAEDGDIQAEWAVTR